MGLILYSLIGLVFLLPSDFLWEGRFYWHMAALGAVAGIPVLYLIYRKTLPFPALFARSGREMTPLSFTLILIVFFSVQMLNSLLDIGLEYVLNALGLSMQESLSYATASATTPVMLLYSALIAPVTEELVYRGFCLRLTQRFGEVFAILFSALVFAVMHENLPQALFAFMAGLVFGYVTLRYSLHWAILLHIINNFVLGDFAETLCAFLPAYERTLLYYLFFGMMLLAAVPALLSARQEISSYVRANRSEKGTWRLALTAVLVITLFLMHLIPAVLMLEIL